MKRWPSLLFMTLFVAGCGGAAQQEKAPPAAPQAAAPAERPMGEDDLRLELIDPGAAPRAPLRYKFHVGVREKMVMDMQMDMTMNPPGQAKISIAMPTMEFGSTLEPRSVTADGDLDYTFTTEKVDLLDDRPLRADVKSKVLSELKAMVGLKGEGVVTARGLTKRAEYNVPAGVSPHIAQTIENMRQSLRQIATPFPLEPVGIGAKWKTTSTIKSKIFSFVQTATFSLVSMNGGHATIQVQIEQQAPAQPVKMDGVPADVKTTLDSYQGRGTGRPVLDLDRLIPTAESEVEVHARFKAEQGTESVAFGNDVKLKLKIRAN
jgi:uncharacterized protein DUF6263